MGSRQQEGLGTREQVPGLGSLRRETRASVIAREAGGMPPRRPVAPSAAYRLLPTAYCLLTSDSK